MMKSLKVVFSFVSLALGCIGLERMPTLTPESATHCITTEEKHAIVGLNNKTPETSSQELSDLNYNLNLNDEDISLPGMGFRHGNQNDNKLPKELEFKGYSQNLSHELKNRIENIIKMFFEDIQKDINPKLDKYFVDRNFEGKVKCYHRDSKLRKFDTNYFYLIRKVLNNSDIRIIYLFAYHPDNPPKDIKVSISNERNGAHMWSNSYFWGIFKLDENSRIKDLYLGLNYPESPIERIIKYCAEGLPKAEVSRLITHLIIQSGHATSQSKSPGVAKSDVALEGEALLVETSTHEGHKP
ncbi:hypothetical protein CROQUDRAFT_714795 [Cronartium quercuum f. sp. fusiforme G11]|uniref:Lipoprotein n=1 Tax=Cronartium quercuum f. sp. fusiforme G11 TaxID=708437 RepID=A0A9P6NPI7_9BASI|nr:hypothetical protein CROQUDRAFT_714795 [Cronartium quercuum f. sp. fusiforme G11]